jgi:hypothetical protein
VFFGAAKPSFTRKGFSHGPLAKQGDVGRVPLFMENMENMEKSPLKIGEVAETKIRPGFR